MADLSAQLKLQQEINGILKKRAAMMKEQSSQLTGQAKLAKQLCKALDCKDLDNMEDRLKGINDELKQAAKNAAATEDEIDRMGDAAGRAEEKTGGFSGKLAAVGGAIGGISGVASAFKGMFGVLKGAGKLLGSVVSGIFSIGKAIISIPFGIYQGLLGMAQGGGGGPSPIKLQLEEIRDAVGSLATNEGKALRNSMMGAKQSFKELGVEGVSFARVFGHGPGGVAEAGKAIMEIAGALGSNLDMLTKMTKKNQLAMAVYSKALGLTATQMRGVADLARASGMEMNDYATKVASFAINMGKQFDINAKLVSKDMGVMLEDFANFGHLGPKTMASVAVYTRKLGFEVKELQGMVDKFDNFEDAAQSASKLNQVFGIQVDAMKMMREEDPAQRLSDLQKAFAATGKSVENMSKQEKKLLASTAGLSDKAAALAFSQKGLGMSYADVTAAADESEGKQLSQAEAMKELSDSIKKTFGSGGGSQFKGFFDAFVQGFGKGIRRSKEFRKIMRNIRKSLRVIFQAGKRVGKAFVDLFPGVKKTFKGIGELFNPKKFRKLGNGLVKVFTDMFKRVNHDPKGGVRVFIQDMKNLFRKFFDSQGPAIKMIKDGATRFFKTFSLIIAEAIRNLKPYIISGLDSITEFIRDPSSFMDSAENAGSFIMEIFGPIIDAIIENEDGDSGITGAFKRLFTGVWDKIGGPTMDAIKKFGETFLTRAIIFIIGKAVMGAAVGALVGGISNMMKKVASATPDGMPPGTTHIHQRGFVDQITALASMDVGTVLKAGLVLAALGAGFAAGLYAVGFSFKQVMGMLGDEDPIQMAVIGLTMVALMKAAASLAHAAADVSRAEDFDYVKVAAVLAATALMVPALGYMGSLVASAFDDISAASMAKALAMTAGLTILTLMTAAAATGISMHGVPGAMEMSVIVIAKSALIVGGLGFLGSLIARAYSGVDPGNVKMATELTSVLVGLTLAAAGGALLIGGILVATGGLAAPIIALGLKTLAIIAAGVAIFAAGFVIAFRTFSKSDLEKASIAGDVAIKVLKASSMGLSAALSAGVSAALASIVEFFGGGNPIDEGLRAMEGFFKLFKQYIPGIINDLLETVQGRDPQVIKDAMTMLDGVMKALEPLIELQMAVIHLAEGMSRRRVPADQLQETFKQMGEFMSKPMQELTALVGMVEDVAGKLGANQSTLKGASAVGQILSAAASFMGAMMGPITKLMEVSTDEHVHHNMMSANDKYKRFNARKFDKAMKAMKDNMPDIIASMGEGIETVIKRISKISFDEGDEARLQKFSSLIGPMANTLKTMMSAFTSFIDLGGDIIKGKDQIHKGTNLSTAFIDSINQLTKNIVFMFTGESLSGGVYTTTGGTRAFGLFTAIEKIIEGVAGLKLPDTSKLQGVLVALDVASKVTKIMTGMIKMMSGSGGAIPKDAKENTEARAKYFTDLNTFISTALSTMTKQMGTFMNTMVTELDGFIAKDATDSQIKKTKNRVKLMVDMFKSIQPITDLISNMMAIFKKDPPPKDDGVTQGPQKAMDFGEFAANAKVFITKIIEALTDPKTGFSKIIDMFTGTGEGATRVAGLIDKVGPRTYKVRTRLKSLMDIMKVVGGIADMITKLSPLVTTLFEFQSEPNQSSGESDFGYTEMTTETMTKIGYVLEQIPIAFGPDGAKLLPIINIIKSIMPKLNGLTVGKKIAEKLDGFTEIIDVISDENVQKLALGQIVLPGGFETLTTFSNLEELITNASGVVDHINSLTIGSVNIETIRAVATAIETMDGMLTRTGGYNTVNAAFAQGTLVVQHLAPEAMQCIVEVTVNLDPSKLAAAVVKAPIKKSGLKKIKTTANKQ